MVVIALGVIAYISENVFVTGFFCSIVVLIVGVFFLNDLLNNLKEQFVSKPYVAILISENVPPEFNIPIDLIEGFEKKRRERGLCFATKSKKVEIKFKNDHLDRTESSKFIKELNNDKNCILLIANANSTLTDSNIDELLKETNKIPLIMPIATHNTIIEKTNENNYKGVLRMLPDNNKQAELIQRFISDYLRIKGQHVAIFGDKINDLYSGKMWDNIANRLRTKGVFVSTGHLIDNSNALPDDIDKVAVVIYAGIPPQVLKIQDKLKKPLENEELNKVKLIMTDGCLGSSTFESIQSENCFILSPIDFDRLPNEKGSYKPIGEDTYELCAKILSISKPTRKSVYETIENGRGNRDKNKNLNIVSVSGKPYIFNSDGNNEGWGYSVYTIENGRIGKKIFE